MDDNLDITAHFIKDVYKLAYQTPIAQFKDSVFQNLNSVLNIDAGTWITRGETNAHFYESEAYVYGLPDGFLQELMHLGDVNEQIQKLFTTVSAQPGETFDILDILSTSEWFSSDLYQLYCKKYELNHSLITTQIEPHNQVMNLVTYARNDVEQKFTLDEKRLSQWIQPCLVEGLKINLLNQYQYKNQDAFYGVFDSFGNLIEAEDSLITLFKQNGLLNDAYSLLIENNSDGSFEYEGVMIETRSHQGLVHVEAMKAPITKQLSNRQLEICHHLISGKTNKEIARDMSLSPDTIHNHLKRVFNILNVSTRHQAIGYLIRQDVLY